MKYLAGSLSLLVLFLNSPLSYAVPPYIGVSAAENISFSGQSCLSATEKALKNDGFEKIVQYNSNATVFAAYRNSNPYYYKALVKCLPNSGVITVVVVAKSPKNAKTKAEHLRSEIQQHAIVKPVPIETAPTRGAQSTEDDDDTVKSFALNDSEEEDGDDDFEIAGRSNIAEQWQSSLLERKKCLSRAEISLRDSGFYKGINFNNDSVQGENDSNYKGIVQCLTSDSLVLFRVMGGNIGIRVQLLTKIQQNF